MQLLNSHPPQNDKVQYAPTGKLEGEHFVSIFDAITVTPNPAVLPLSFIDGELFTYPLSVS